MSTNTSRLLLAAMLCCAGPAARATDEPAKPAPDRTTLMTLAPGAQLIFSEAAEEGPVKNAPYTANVIKERQQTLGDGNQISHRTDARVYRDSAGRTREETLDASGATRSAVIVDPVAGDRWILNPHTKIATRLYLPPFARNTAGKAPRNDMGQVIERHTRPDGSEEVLIKRVPRPNGDASTNPPQKMTIYAESVDVSTPPFQRGGARQLGPVLSGAFADTKWAAQASTRELRPRDIEGVKATGKLRTYDIPAGKLGNRNPIVVSDETWYAPELHITLSSKHSDPRTGDSLFRIENLKREEPAPALFAPPADYAIKDLRQRAIDKPAQ